MNPTLTWESINRISRVEFALRLEKGKTAAKYKHMSSSKNLEALIEKRKRLDEQIRAKKARIRSEQSKRRRKEDTRRKIITGALALEHASKHPDSSFARTLMSLLEAYVSIKDRHLFPFPDDAPNDNPALQISPLAKLFGRR